jgi:hypothetical protein
MTKISNQYSLTNILTADLANSRLGINNVSPTVALDVTGAGKFSGNVVLSGSDSRFNGGDSVGRLILSNSNTTTYIGLYGATHPTLPYVMSFVVNAASALAIASTGAATFSSSVTALKYIANSQATYASLTYEETFKYASSPAGIWFGNSFNSNNNVGLQLRVSNDGTSVQALTISPTGAATFQSVNAKTNTGQWHLSVQDNTSMAAGVGGGISFNGYKTGTTAQGLYAAIDGYKENSTAGNELGGFRIWTSNGTNLVTRLTISSSGAATFSSTINATAASQAAGIVNLTSFSTASGLHPLIFLQRSGGAVTGTIGYDGTNARMFFSSSAGDALALGGTGGVVITNLGSGAVSATSGLLSTTSDMTLKVEDGYIDNALEKISQLKPRYFYWKEESGLPTDIRQLGFYAQEVNQALGEEAANTPKNENDKWGIYDRGIIAMLTKAIQELSTENTSLINRIEALENK